MDEEQIRFVVQTASRAPSVHNTQPWRFVATPNGLDVYGDESRWLQQIDPAQRQLHLSCGVAGEFARLAVRSLGRGCVVRNGPLPEESSVLLRLTVGEPQPQTATERRMLEAVGVRHTVRSPYDREPVSVGAFVALQRAATDYGCWLRRIENPGERGVLTVLLDRAEQLEMADPAYRAELARWRSPQVTPTEGIAQSASAGWEDDSLVSDLPLRDFSGVGSAPPDQSGPPPDVTHDTVVVLGTNTDTPQEWLRAGRALAAMLLTLTDDGLVAQPLGPVMDVGSTRDALRRELHVLGFPQLALRVGHGQSVPTSSRRPVEEVLVSHGVRSGHDEPAAGAAAG